MIWKFFFAIFFVLFAYGGYGQNAAFPYSISVNSVPGKCYDDCRIIIHIYDDNGNEILVNPQTHNAQDLNTYPLYNVQYTYRNVSAGTNIRYDTINDIQVTTGTYCVGVIAHVPVVNPGGTLDYVLVDTSICNVEVATDYNHMEASILSAQARNDFEWSWDENNPREFCGWRPSYSCADRGRIQLKINKGKFPYRVLILNAAQDTVRNATFYERQQSGEDSIFADFKDFYTFDQIPVGNYSIRVSDSCDYALWLSINIPDAHPTYYNRVGQIGSNWSDSNVVYFYVTKNCPVDIHDYDKPYFDSILQYRFINPGGDITDWHSLSYNIWDLYWTYLSDTLHHINHYCQLDNDTVLLQLRDLCRDTIYTSAFYYDYDNRCFDVNQEFHTYSFDVVTTPDTCFVHANSGLTTQTYSYYGYGGCWDVQNDNPDYPAIIYGYQYTAPISYDVYSTIDSTLIAHNEGNDFWWLGSDITYMVDTVIPVHITWTDAMGCLLTSRDDVLTFDVENIGDNSYPLYSRAIDDEWGWNGCCWDRYVYVRQDINADLFRKDITVKLFESPLYNSENFTAVCQNGEWSFTPEDSTNHHTYLEFGHDEGGWQVTVRDSVCLPPGRYKFVVTTTCGTDTLESVFWDSFYRDSLSLDSSPTYDMTQICDRLLVHQTSNGISGYYYYIDANVDNNEPVLNTDQPWTEVVLENGVVGGFSSHQPDENGNFVFTIPGEYVIRTSAWENCTSLQHYDTIEYVPVYIDFDQAFAIVCDNISDTGFVSVHAINGSEPYTYYLYDQPDLQGSIIGTSDVGRFLEVRMVTGQQLSVMVEDSCHNSFYINLTATPISQSALAWEFGDFTGNGHCEGDSIHIAALPFAFEVAYQWIGPNGFSSTDRVNHIYLPYGSESGWYTLEVMNTGCKTRVMDSVFIQVIKAPTITILSDTTVCSGDGVTLGFQAQGNGTVTFDIMHTGAPASGSNSFTANPGSTIFQHYPIESDNLFWPENISDSRCTYNYIIDTVQVSLFNSAITAPPTPITVDGYACYNHTASLRASSNIPTPYYVYWYQDTRQQSLLQCDTIYSSSNYSTLYVNNVVGDTTVYVTISNATQCAATYGALNHIVNMHNGNTILLPGEGARFYDSGGEIGNYGDNEHFTHTFSCPGESHLDLTFNSVDIAIGDTLHVYSGAAATPSSLLASLTHTASINSLLVNQSAVTFKFNSNWTNNRDGWSIDIFTSVPMTPVSAHVSPLNYDTVAAVLCTSETPYPNLYFPNLDISHPTEYLTDTLFVSDDGCQTAVHLDVLVNPVSHTDLHDFLMPCQLPTVWNGLTFSDYGTQTITFTNTFGCDSIVTMTAHWAPPVDSTTIYVTIVENQLPYHINGLTFNEPGVQVATLTTHDGCDSVVTVHLFVHYNVTAEADSIICDNALPFVWNGATFTQNDTQTVTITAHTGADSTLTMIVFVNPTSLTTFTDTTCQYSAYSGFGFSLSESETTVSGFTTLYRTETNIFNCDSVIELHLLITPVITPDFIAEPDKAILSENPDIHFTNITDIEDLAGMEYIWFWDYGDGASDSTSALQTEHLYSQWGDYTVTLTLTVNECVSEFSIPVIIEADLVFPNVITPNGDGVNDVFAIKDMNPDRANRLFIVDRWGKTVFDQQNYQTYMKDDQIYNPELGFGTGNISDGVYFYTFFYEGAVRTIKFNGSITVIK